MKKQWYLGLDYGKSWIGMAVGNAMFGVSTLASVKYVNEEKCISDILRVIEEYEVGEIVLGIPQGLLKEEIEELGKKLEKKLQMKVNLQDEANSSKQAIKTARASAISVGKLKEGEHSLAASEILRRFLYERVDD